MRIVVALGGNALLRRGEAMTAAAQQENVRLAAARLAGARQRTRKHVRGPMRPRATLVTKVRIRAMLTAE